MTLYNSFIEELPLILFTVVAQSAVGFSLVYSLNNNNAVYKDNSYKKFSIIFLALTLLSMIISVFHLGDPLHAPYMITRIFGFSQAGSHVISWLPLEIAGLAVMVLIGAVIFLKGIQSAIYLLPIVGFAMLFAMSNIYGSMADTIPTWNLDLTILLFFASAILLGSFTYMAFLGKDDKKVSVIISVIGFILFVLALVLYTYHLGNVRVDGIKNVFDMTDGHYTTLMTWGILLNGLALVLVLLPNSSKVVSIIAFLLSLTGVFLTRIIFYGLIVSHIFLG